MKKPNNSELIGKTFGKLEVLSREIKIGER
jgi:hypothetical protein